MAAGTASLCSTLLFVGVFVFVSAEQKNITAESGQNVTLTCRAPNNNIIVVEWSRADLRTEYVLLYRDRQFDPDEQHPSFKNRVDLQDRQMKDGDVSLILKDVRTSDAGTYECRVFMRETRSWKSISSIYLSVPPDQTIITAESGENVTLPCQAPNNNIKYVHWSRADLNADHVFLHQDGHSIPHNQHPSFKNRVDLQDRQMKDGDVSLILKDVSTADTGTYKCHVYMVETRSWEHSIINLKVLPDQKIITAESGQSVTLPCRAPNNNIRSVEWSRAHLEPEYVLLYRASRFYPYYQHPSFKNRVDLQDRQMKDGDVSLILKDVTTADKGTYECRVFMGETHSWESINIIFLSFHPGQRGGHTEDEDHKDKGKEDGSVGLIGGVLVSAAVLLVVVAAVVGFLIRKLKLSQGSKECPTDQKVKQPLQSPQLNCESDDPRTDRNKRS